MVTVLWTTLRVLVAVAVLVGCGVASGLAPEYRAPSLPADQLAIVEEVGLPKRVSERGPGQDGTILLSVDGVAVANKWGSVARAQRPGGDYGIAVAPGERTIEASYVGQFNNRYYTGKPIRATFLAKPGHVYRVFGKSVSPEQWSMWIEELRTGTVVFGQRRD